MEKGLEATLLLDLGGAEMSPLKSSGVSLLSVAMGRGFLASVMQGLGNGLPPNIPSSSDAELEAEEPSGDDVGGGDDTEEEQGELVSDRAEMVVLGDNMAVIAVLLVSDSSGRMLTPSSTQFMMGLKILFLLLARYALSRGDDPSLVILMLATVSGEVGVGGRLREREARGDLPRPGLVVVRSIGALGEAGEERRERPTGPMGEAVIILDRWGEFGGRMAELRRSRGVTGDLSGVYCFCSARPVLLGCLVSGEGWRGE